MTDRLAGFIVTLEKPIREDDAEATLAAIRMIRGVVSVDPVVADPMHHMAISAARHDIGRQLWKVLYPEESKG